MDLAKAEKWAEENDLPRGRAPEGATLAALLAARRFNIADPPPKPRSIFRLGEAVIATPGNLVAISAQAKAGKTALLGGFIAATLDPTGDTLGVHSSNPTGGALVHFDTEQSRYDHYAVVMRALKRAAKTSVPDWLRSYCLADVGIDQRLGLLRFELEAAREAHGAIHSVILDGVADLCHDPNNPEEAFALVAELHRLAIDFDTAILCVLHENPGSADTGKTRGHLGSQLERKAETNLRLAKDADAITVVFSEKSRHAHIPKEQGARFAWSDEAEMHVSVESTATTKTNAKLESLRALGTELFRGVPEAAGLTWKQAHDGIKKLEGLKSQSGARKKFDALLTAKVIRKAADEKYRLA